MTNKSVFFEGKKMEWEVVSEKIQRQIVGFDDKIMMVNVRFEKDGIGTLHNHHHSQVSYVAEGKFEVTIANETRILEKGDSFFIPSNAINFAVLYSTLHG